jgi:hypothetical protein
VSAHISSHQQAQESGTNNTAVKADEMNQSSDHPPPPGSGWHEQPHPLHLNQQADHINQGISGMPSTTTDTLS